VALANRIVAMELLDPEHSYTYTVSWRLPMKNITLAVEEDILERARLVAAEQKTTVNAMVREFLVDVASRDERLEKARAGLRELMRNSKGRMRPDFKFDREETHER
jgi:hypothetical protein